MLKAEELRTAIKEVSGVQINVVSYKIGDRFYCHISNLDPGATIARTDAASQEEAEQSALHKVAERLRGKPGVQQRP